MNASMSNDHAMTDGYFVAKQWKCFACWLFSIETKWECHALCIDLCNSWSHTHPLLLIASPSPQVHNLVLCLNVCTHDQFICAVLHPDVSKWCGCVLPVVLSVCGVCALRGIIKVLSPSEHNWVLKLDTLLQLQHWTPLLFLQLHWKSHGGQCARWDPSHMSHLLGSSKSAWA